jgi:hypothetical protein
MREPTEEEPMKTTLMVALAALAMFSAVPTFATDADLSAQVAGAKTAADHEAIADTYAKEAQEAEANAAAHEKMAASYKGLGKMGQFHGDTHCAAIAKRERETAKDLNDLAAAHRAQAKAAK